MRVEGGHTPTLDRYDSQGRHPENEPSISLWYGVDVYTECKS